MCRDAAVIEECQDGAHCGAGAGGAADGKAGVVLHNEHIPSNGGHIGVTAARGIVAPRGRQRRIVGVGQVGKVGCAHELGLRKEVAEPAARPGPRLR